MTAAQQHAAGGMIAGQASALMVWKLGFPMCRKHLARAMLECMDEDLRRASPHDIISWLAACGFTNKEIERATPLLARLLARHTRT